MSRMQQEHIMEEVSTWSEGNPPAERSGHRIWCNDSFLYSVGGFNPSAGPLREVWRLNISTGEWEQLSEGSSDGAPSTCISHCMVSVGQELLTFGGTGFPFGSEMTSEVHACDKDTGKWRVVPSEGDVPQALYGQASRRMGEYVYIVGGTSGYCFSLQTYAFHLPTQTWSCLATYELFKGDEPAGRYKAEIGVLPGHIFVVGGSASFVIFSLDEIPVLNINSGNWSVKSAKPDPRVNAYPSPRKGHASVQRGTDLYIIGGASEQEVFDDIWKLELTTLTWTRTSLVLPVPLYFHDAALSPNGTLFVYGGSSSLGSSERSSAIYRARLEAPPLLEAAWETFTNSCPTINAMNVIGNDIENVGSSSSMELLAAGVPRKLIQRLKKLPKGNKHH